MIETLLQTQSLIIVAATLSCFLAVFALGSTFVGRDHLSSRLKLVAKRREELQLAAANRKRPTASALRQQQGRNVHKILVERLKLLDPTRSENLKLKLASAGLRGPGPLYAYAFFRLVGPIALAIVAGIYMFIIAGEEFATFQKVGVTALAAVVGFFLPQVLVHNRAQKRQAAITKGFPDALDLMVICVEAGLSLEASFARTSDEMVDTAPELAEELGLTTAELAFLPDRRTPLENLAKRTGLPSVKSLITALIQSEKYGTPVAVSLRVLAGDQRDERLSRAEKKAGALPAQLAVPMIVFFLPVLFIVILGPAAISIADKF